VANSSVSIEFLTQPFTDMLAEVDVARDKGTRAGLQATGRLIAKTARGRAPVYQGSEDPRAARESGSLKKSIKASRVTRQGAADYSSTVQPKGSVHGSDTGKEKRGVPLYRSKQEEKFGYMASGIDAANGAGARSIYEAAYDAAFARFR